MAPMAVAKTVEFPVGDRVPAAGTELRAFDDALFSRDGAVLGGGVDFSLASSRTMATLEIKPYGAEPLRRIVRAELQVRVEARSAGPPATTIPSTTTLRVDYNPAAGTTYRAKDLFVANNAQYLRLTVERLAVADESGAPITDASILNRLSLDARVQEERYYTPDLSDAPTPFVPAMDLPKGEVRLQWKEVKWAERYDLEWTYVNNYDGRGTPGRRDPGLVNYDFRFEGTRVPVTGTSYHLPILFERGWLLWRVRAVGRTGEGFKQAVVGPWAPINSDRGTVASAPASFVLETPAHDLVPSVGETTLNWQHIATFTEEGKRKDVVSYLDGTLRNRQTVTKLNSDNLVIVGETIYDHRGRPAIDMLASPVTKEGARLSGMIGYQRDFNLNPDGVPYSYRDFELRRPDAPEDEPPAARMLDTARNGAGMYFSPNNPDQRGHQAYVPDAAGFPFVQRTYTPDETGRLQAVGMPGPHHQIGSGHERKFFYGVPTQDELDRLFGNDAGLAQHYKKRLAVNADGQATVEYLDSAGRVVAIALAGGSPDPLVPVDGVTATPTTVDLLEGDNQLLPDADELRSAKTILVGADNTEYRFTYRFTPPDLHDSTCARSPVCYDCVYNLEIQIIDSSGRRVETRQEHIGSLRDLGACGVGDGRPVNLAFSLSLDRGSYRVVKRLTIDQEAVDQYAEHYLKNNACPPQMRDRLAPDFDPRSCDAPCTRCDVRTQAAEVQMRDGRRLSLPVDERAPTPTACSRGCGADPIETPCEAGYQMMLADVSPGGQYADFESLTEARPERFPLSVLYEHNALPLAHANWRHPARQYLDANGTPSRIPIRDGDPAFCASPSDGTCAPQDLNHVEDFVHHWRPSWAEALVPYHPEYGYYRWCREHEEVVKYEQRLRTVNTFGEAQSLEEFDPSPTARKPLPRDPLSSELPADILIDTRCGLTRPETFSLHQLVHLTVGCNNPNLSDAEARECARRKAEVRLGADPGLADHEWRIFRDFYLAKRASLLGSMRDRFASGTPGYFPNQCIGADAPSTCAPPMNHPGYRSREKRFPVAEEALAALPNGSCELKRVYVERKLYQRCGKCPEQMDLETFLSAAASDGRLTQSFEFPRFPVIPTRELLDKWPNPRERSYGWKAVERGDELEISLVGGGREQCRIRLHKSMPAGSPSVAWNDIRWIGWLAPLPDPGHFPRSEGRNFKAKGVLRDGQMVELEGEISCLNLASCSLPRLCEVSDVLGGEVVRLARQVLADRRFLSPGRPVLVHEEGSATSSVLGPTLRRFKPDATRYFWAFMHWGSGPVPSPSDRTTFTAELRAGAPDEEFATRCPLTFRLTTIQHTFEEPGLRIRGVREVYRTIGEGDACGSKQIYLDAAAANGDEVAIIVTSACHQFGECCVRPSCQMATATQPPGVGTGGPGRPPGGIPGLDPDVVDPPRLIDLPACDQCCYPPTPRFPYQNQCAAQQREALEVTVQQETREALAGLRRNIREKYLAQCLNNIRDPIPNFETFVASFEERIYHYTLFYYDQAGNLMRTVPPKGVVLLTPAQITRVQNHRAGRGAAFYPAHTMASVYRYNTLNEVTQKSTPDSGATNTWYDRLGRPVVVQDARQRAEGRRYTFMVYDPLGRIIETGEVIARSNITPDIARDDDDRARWLAGKPRTEQTLIHYDAPINAEVNAFFEGGQQNLRKRIASQEHEETAPDGTTFRHATHYSYDVHGNVKELVQENPQMPTGHRVKKILYDYDLVSRAVKRVTYQRGQTDQFIHRYSSDADNRLTQVETSTDGIIWDRDARYHYYQHGPLARLELGEELVQGLDYAYTIHGWPKGINSDSLSRERDIGKDGTADIPPDAFGLSLGYYPGDYRSIAAAPVNLRFHADTATGPLAGAGLFNGNISHIVTALSGLLPEQRIHASKYRYDQLGWLRGMTAVRELNEGRNDWASAREVPDYAETYTYDPNGNIMTVTRNGVGARRIDDLEYHYDESGTNRLSYVADRAGTSGPDLPNQSPANYAYDPAGRMTRDQAAGIRAIRWTATNKVRRVQKGDTAIDFAYDSGGHRAMKRASDRTTWYVRDATGKILATYAQRGSELTWDTSPMYGAGRLGMIVASRSLTGGAAITSLHDRGTRRYELAGHTGNVLATIADRKAPSATADGTGAVLRASVLDTQDYYPFGMMMPGRTSASESYRFGFQGMERDDDWTGQGNSYTTEFRQYDTRLGRWLSTDPVENPGSSPYASMANSPLIATDKGGDVVDFSAALEAGRHSEINDLLEQLEEFSGLALRISETGTLEVATTLSGRETRSRTLRADLLEAISSEENISVSIREDELGSHANPEERSIILDPVQIADLEESIRENYPVLDPWTFSWGLVFAHELYHIPVGNREGTFDPPIRAEGPTGPTVDAVNRIRAELGVEFGRQASYMPEILRHRYSIGVPFEGPSIGGFRALAGLRGDIPEDIYLETFRAFARLLNQALVSRAYYEELRRQRQRHRNRELERHGLAR